MRMQRHCRECGRPLQWDGVGRRPQFCSTACRVRAHRQRQQTVDSSGDAVRSNGAGVDKTQAGATQVDGASRGGIRSGASHRGAQRSDHAGRVRTGSRRAGRTRTSADQATSATSPGEPTAANPTTTEIPEPVPLPVQRQAQQDNTLPAHAQPSRHLDDLIPRLLAAIRAHPNTFLWRQCDFADIPRDGANASAVEDAVRTLLAKQLVRQCGTTPKERVSLWMTLCPLDNNY